MNGRIYDYNLGRFMSVDPFIQSPTSTQSVNPYSYIMNNPLAGTDPTGYACEAATGTRICSKDIGDIKVKDVSKVTITKNDNGSAKVSVTMNNGSVRSQNFNLSSSGGLGDIASKQSYGNDPNFAKGYGSAKGDMSGILSMTGPALAVDAVKAGIETANEIADEYEKSGLSMSTFIVAGKAAGEAAIDVGAKKFRLPGVAKKTHGHHSDPKFLGGEKKQPLTTLDEQVHKDLHNDMNGFLKERADDFGNHMRPQRGNSGQKIRQNFTRQERLEALRDFYNGPGAKYSDAARDFFKQHQDL